MSDVHAIYQEAEQLKEEGKIEEAAEKLEQVLAQDESHVLSHMTLAVLYSKLGKHDDAVKHGERACELEPTDAINFTALSVTYQRAYAGTQDMSYIQKAEEAMAKAHMIQGGPGHQH